MRCSASKCNDCPLLPEFKVFAIRLQTAYTHHRIPKALTYRCDYIMQLTYSFTLRPLHLFI